MKNLLLVPLAFVLLPISGQAAVRYIPDEFATIQIAIQSPEVVDGDVLIVRPGTYFENIDFLGKNITLKSELGPETATIDGGGIWTTVVFQHGEGQGAVLDGFTVTGGEGYGISADGASPTIINNIVTGNGSTGIRCTGEGPVPLISGNTISGNSGGGIRCYGEWSAPIRAEISNNVIMDNIAGQGGGISLYYSESLVTGNTITGNVATSHLDGGGGIYSGDWRSQDIILENLIEQNHAAEGGGGLCLDKAFAVVRGNVIASNSASYGGGIWCYDCSPQIIGNVIRDNKASTDSAEGAKGGGLLVGEYAAPMVLGNSIFGNTAETSGGGVHFNHCNEDTLFAGNLVANNVSTKGGGGIGCNRCSPTIANCTVCRNTAGVAGGGLVFSDATDTSVSNTIVWDNTAPHSPQIYKSAESTPYFAHCDIEGGWPGQYIIDIDPFFVDPEAGDFHLCFTSPCRNAGNNSWLPGELTVDFEEDPRVVQGTVDIGADEFFFHLYAAGAAVPGEPLRITILGPPGADPVRLVRGYSVLDPPWPTMHGDLYLETPPAQVVRLGAIPGHGVLALTVTVPADWVPGESYPFQALVGPWGAPATRLTNLMTLEVE